MYGNDNDDYTMPAYYSQNGFATTYWWWGYTSTGPVDSTKGFLQPYAKSTGINSDPIFLSTVSQNTLGSLGYGYNYDYLSVTNPLNYNQDGIPYSSIGEPASTLGFATSAQWDNYEGPTPYLQGVGLVDAPSFNDPNVQGRYSGQAVVAWTDGHAKSLTPVVRSADMPTYSGTITVTTLKTYNLGDASPIPLPGDCSGNPSLYDQYYELQKPSGFEG